MYEKRQILLDRESLINHLKKNGYNGDLLLGMSDKKLFELYSMEENDLGYYHADDARPSKNEYTVGLGDDVELGETTVTRTVNVAQEPKVALDMIQNTDPTNLSGTGEIEIQTGPTKTIVQVTPSSLRSGEAPEATSQSYDPEKSKITGKGNITSKTIEEPMGETIKYDKKTLEEKFSNLAKLKELKADKKMVMEMLEKQSRPTATKAKIMEYILKN